MRCLLYRSGVVLALCALVVLAGCGGTKRTTSPSHTTALNRGAKPGRSGLPSRFFSPRSFWNQQLAASAPTDPRSAQMVATLTAEVQREQATKSGPWINTVHDGVPIITVSANQPTARVTVRASNGETNPALDAAWRAVPLPPDARPSSGDEDLAVWQPSTDRMWEFFGMTRTAGHWEARWGGAMQHVSTNPGVYGPGAWPGAQSYWGVTASSLPLVGGAITIPQLQAGHIDHALALAIPAPRAGVFAAPAERTDGSSKLPGALPEGARLRLDPRLNLGSLSLPPVTLAIAQAAQRYGIIVRDTSGTVAFAAQDPDTTAAAHSDPYYGAHGLFRGEQPGQLLASFPWNHLQVVRLDLRTSP